MNGKVKLQAPAWEAQCAGPATQARPSLPPLSSTLPALVRGLSAGTRCSRPRTQTRTHTHTHTHTHTRTRTHTHTRSHTHTHTRAHTHTHTHVRTHTRTQSETGG